MPKRTLTQEQKNRILERDAYVCAYCLGDATEVEHITPWSLSYDDNDLNLVASCHECNALAGCKIFSSFSEKRSYIIAKREKRRASMRHRPITCTLCGRLFRPYVGCDATMFLCNECAVVCTTMDARDQEAYATRKLAELECG